MTGSQGSGIRAQESGVKGQESESDSAGSSVVRRLSSIVHRLSSVVRRHWDALAFFAASLILYAATAAPTVATVFDDSLEFHVVLPTLGIAHPSGYPLYTLLGKLFTALIPFRDPAGRANLLSALAAALGDRDPVSRRQAVCRQPSGRCGCDRRVRHLAGVVVAGDPRRGVRAPRAADDSLHLSVAALGGGEASGGRGQGSGVRDQASNVKRQFSTTLIPICGLRPSTFNLQLATHNPQPATPS